MKISVIVPCFNLEHYIKRCLESIVKQRYDKALYEIILILDGCTDGTASIAEKYLFGKGVNVKYFTVNFHSVGLARNLGLEKSEGNYIWFVDGDDYLTDMLAFEKLAGIMERGCYSAVYMQNFESDMQTKDDHAIWRYFYSREFLNGMQFKDDMPHDSDWEFTIRCKRRKDYVENVFKDGILYHYTFPREGSITYERRNKRKNYGAFHGRYFICTMIKDEHEYIREWVEHHRKLGFDKIVLYDDGSSRPYDSELGDLIECGFVEMRNRKFEGEKRQIKVFEDFVYGGKWTDNDFCAFIDVDEFIYFDGAETVNEFIKPYLKFAGVGLSWRMYNANGRVKKPFGPTPEAYVTEFTSYEPRIKVIARLNDISSFPTVHNFIPKNGKLLVTTGGRPVYGMHPGYCDYTGGHIKHYITKSWEDWVKRLKRGNVTSGLRTVESFFRYNPDLADRKKELTENLNMKEFPTLRWKRKERYEK